MARSQKASNKAGKTRKMKRKAEKFMRAKKAERPVEEKKRRPRKDEASPAPANSVPPPSPPPPSLVVVGEDGDALDSLGAGGAYFQRFLEKTMASRTRSRNGKYSIRDLAKETGVDSGSLSRFLRGLRAPTMNTAVTVLKTLGASQKERDALVKAFVSEATEVPSGKKGEKASAHNERRALARFVEEDHRKAEIIVISAEIGAFAFKELFASIDTLLRERNAIIRILPLRPQLRALETLEQSQRVLDQFLKDKYSNAIGTEFVFNSHLRAVESQINVQQTNPLTGLRRIAKGAQSIIVAHSKQHIEFHPTGNETHPKMIASTGVGTLPDYLLDTRIGRIARNDHKLGFLHIQIDGDRFYMKNVQVREDGTFNLVNRRYTPRGSYFERAAGQVNPDRHVGLTSRANERIFYEIMLATMPRALVEHDFSEGASISHHRAKSRKARQMVPRDLATLHRELLLNRAKFNEILTYLPEDAILYMANSNHPEHFIQYLDSNRWTTDDKNFQTALWMASRYYNAGLNPFDFENEDDFLEAAKAMNINPVSEIIDPMGRGVWLSPDEDVRIEGVLVSSHGHLGLNGSRGSLRGMEAAYQNSITGHGHVPGLFHDAMAVGSMTPRKLDYNKGPATWATAGALIHEGGQKQLICGIGGRWHAEWDTSYSSLADEERERIEKKAWQAKRAK